LLEDAASWYAREGSWVDWARTRIRGGYERGPLASALARLSNAVKERRERFNNQFAAALLPGITKALISASSPA